MCATHADANLADEDTQTGQGNSSRAASDAPASSGHGLAKATKRVKRSRSVTPEGGLAAYQQNWSDFDSGQAVLKTEPVKSEWQGFATSRNDDPGASQAEPAYNATGVPSMHAAAAASNGKLGPSSSHAVQELQPDDKSQIKPTRLKVKLKFKPS